MNATKQPEQETSIKDVADKAWDDMIIHLKEKYPPDGNKPKCDHEWNNGGNNPEYCLKCGMSLMAHAFMECP